MKKTIHAQVAAKAMSFPDVIEIQYQPTDQFGSLLGPECYRAGPFTWQQVQNLFLINAAYALECEVYFAEGHAALIHRHDDFELDLPEGTETAG